MNARHISIDCADNIRQNSLYITYQIPSAYAIIMLTYVQHSLVDNNKSTKRSTKCLSEQIYLIFFFFTHLTFCFYIKKNYISHQDYQVSNPESAIATGYTKINVTSKLESCSNIRGRSLEFAQSLVKVLSNFNFFELPGLVKLFGGVDLFKNIAISRTN